MRCRLPIFHPPCQLPLCQPTPQRSGSAGFVDRTSAFVAGGRVRRTVVRSCRKPAAPETKPVVAESPAAQSASDMIIGRLAVDAMRVTNCGPRDTRTIDKDMTL